MPGISKRRRTKGRRAGHRTVESMHAAVPAPGLARVHTFTQRTADTRIKVLQTQCWCGKSYDKIDADIVRRCETFSCGRPGCTPS